MHVRSDVFVLGGEKIKMRKDDCIFCKIANGEIPTNQIYEDDDFKVIMDIEPATKGHALVLPKNHFDDIYEIDSETLGKAVKVGQKVIKHATKILQCDGYNLMQNNGEVSGQTVFHFHLHLIPRYKNMENEHLLSWKPNPADSEELKQLTQKIKMEE